MKKTLLPVLAAGLWLLVSSAPGFAATDHTGKFSTYEGSKTCRVCHEDVVDDVSHVLHYRLLGQPQGVYDFLTNKLVTTEKGKGNRY